MYFANSSWSDLTQKNPSTLFKIKTWEDSILKAHFSVLKARKTGLRGYYAEMFSAIKAPAYK